MLIKTFSGINNVAKDKRLKPDEFTRALDVDLASTGTLRARRGHAPLVTGTTAHSVFEAPFGVFCVVDRDLKLFDTAGALLRTVYQGLGAKRVWYILLSDGRVGFSNGLINGIADLTTTYDWGMPTPVDAGAGVAGEVPYFITYVRLSDGLEGPPAYGGSIDPAQAIVGLPVRAGYTISLYLSPGGAPLYAGNTSSDAITPLALSALGAAYTEPPLTAPPVGILMAQFGPRVLIADGPRIWATQPFRDELCDATKDFLQMPDPVTLIYGVEQAGVFIGTTKNLFFAGGTTFDQLKAQPIAASSVVLGSAVEIDTPFLPEKIRPKDVQQGTLCIIDGFVQLISGTGNVTPLTDQRYRTTHTEVYATARIRDGVLQYLATPV